MIAIHENYYKKSNPPQVITQKQSHINSVSTLLKRSVLLVKIYQLWLLFVLQLQISKTG